MESQVFLALREASNKKTLKFHLELNFNNFQEKKKEKKEKVLGLLLQHSQLWEI